MAKKMLKGDAASSTSSSYGYSGKGGRSNSKIHPRSPSESNLPRRMAFESSAAAESRLGGNLSTSAVNFAPSGGGGHVTMLKNRVLYHSRSDFREQEARV